MTDSPSPLLWPSSTTRWARTMLCGSLETYRARNNPAWAELERAHLEQTLRGRLRGRLRAALADGYRVAWPSVVVTEESNERDPWRRSVLSFRVELWREMYAADGR